MAFLLRPNAFVDGIDYPDTGCETGGPSCLACPLARCVHDVPGGARALLQQAHGERARAMRDGGASLDEIAAAIGVSRRTAHRTLTGR